MEPLRRFGLCLALLLTGLAWAQAPKSMLTQSFTYTFKGEDGSNASAVAWDPEHEVYVTVIAGNEAFPLEVFDAQGNLKYATTTKWDWRGLWYNPKSKGFEGNGAGDYGWAQFKLDESLAPTPIHNHVEGQNQPDFQSVGSFDAAKKAVVFLDYSYDGLSFYPAKKPKKVSHLNLDWSKAEIGNINTTTVACSGHAGYEFVLLDVVERKLLFFNREGKLAATSALPVNAPMNDAFTFSFANDHAFLYDLNDRTWYAYKVW